MSQSNQPNTRWIAPSSRREIEVHRQGQVPPEDRELHICPSCESELVQPSHWSHRPDGHFTLTLDCPNCGWGESGVYRGAQVAQLEDRLDEGLISLLDDLRRLTQANMASDIDRFVEGLNFDRILPEDF